jgi:hypothetical protein
MYRHLVEGCTVLLQLARLDKAWHRDPQRREDDRGACGGHAVAVGNVKQSVKGVPIESVNPIR